MQFDCSQSDQCFSSQFERCKQTHQEINNNSKSNNNNQNSNQTEMPHVDPGILCFQHCDKKSKVFCLELPDYCPICDSPMNSIELRIPPFQVPYPFTYTRRAPCSVLIRPTEGDFLQ